MSYNFLNIEALPPCFAPLIQTKLDYHRIIVIVIDYPLLCHDVLIALKHVAQGQSHHQLGL
jgi:hypothetical protein